MREMVKMVIVLTLLSSLSGGLLAAIRNNTQDRIDSQVLKFVKGPAIQRIMEGAANNPIADRFAIQIDDTKKNFFVGVFDGEPKVVAFETKGSGYGGDVGVMVAVNVETGKIRGVSVTTHNETPGLGLGWKRMRISKASSRACPLGLNPRSNRTAAISRPYPAPPLLPVRYARRLAGRGSFLRG